MEAIKKVLPRGVLIGGFITAPVIAGVGGGLLAWWAEDAIATQIESKPWLIPIAAGLATLGVVGYFSVKAYA
jgi:hypothetical protein